MLGRHGRREILGLRHHNMSIRPVWRMGNLSSAFLQQFVVIKGVIGRVLHDCKVFSGGPSAEGPCDRCWLGMGLVHARIIPIRADAMEPLRRMRKPGEEY